MLKSSPVPIDIDTTENWRVVATKKGFDDFTQDLDLRGRPGGEDDQDRALRDRQAPAGRRVQPRARAPARSPSPSGPSPAASGSGTGTLNMNSIPVSKVLLDGKPLGSTPKVGVSVPAGLAHGHLHPPGARQADAHRGREGRRDQDGGRQVQGIARRRLLGYAQGPRPPDGRGPAFRLRAPLPPLGSARRRAVALRLPHSPRRPPPPRRRRRRALRLERRPAGGAQAARPRRRPLGALLRRLPPLGRIR